MINQHNRHQRIILSFEKRASAVRRRSFRAFTLIELLVVVAIIGILAGILIPVIGGVRRNSSNVKCLSNLRQLGATTIMYANDHSGRLPMMNARFNADLWPYLGAGDWPGMSGSIFPDELRDTVFECPMMDDDEGAANARSYGGNSYLKYKSLTGKDAPSGGNFSGGPVLQILYPAKVVLFADTFNSSLLTPITESRWRQLAQRHDGHVNVVFADGHVESVSADYSDAHDRNSVFWRGVRIED